MDLCARRQACWRSNCARRVVRLLAPSQGRASQAPSAGLSGRIASRCLFGISASPWRWRDAVIPSPITTEAIARIGALYGIEEETRGKPIHVRRSIRQTRAKPLIDDLQSWMIAKLRSLSNKSETAGAIRYALARWR